MEREKFFESRGNNIYGTLTLPEEGTGFAACLFIGGADTRIFSPKSPFVNDCE